MRIGDVFRTGVTGVCATVALGLPPAAAATEVVTQPFTAPGEHSFVVPPAVTSIHGGIARGAHAGLDKIRFEGVLDGNRRLAAGTYRVSSKASTGAGSVSASQHPAFTLLP